MDKREQDMLLLRRIKLTQDGQDFIDYLRRLSHDNYCAFKRSRSEDNEMHKGIGLALDSLVEAFEQCERDLTPANPTNIWS